MVNLLFLRKRFNIFYFLQIRLSPEAWEIRVIDRISWKNTKNIAKHTNINANNLWFWYFFHHLLRISYQKHGKRYETGKQCSKRYSAQMILSFLPKTMLKHFYYLPHWSFNCSKISSHCCRISKCTNSQQISYLFYYYIEEAQEKKKTFVIILKTSRYPLI